MGALDWLFEGSPPPNVSSTTTTQTNMPDWYQEYLRGMMGKANAIAAEPFQAYTGARVAPATADQTQSYDITRANIGAADPSLALGTQYATTAGAGFNQGEFDKYMNPYTEGVVDQIATLGARNLSEKLLPQVNDTFIGAGQFGGTRNAEFTNRAVRDSQEAILAQQGQALMDSQNKSMTAYQTGQGQTLAAGQQLGQLGQLEQQTGLKDAAALQAIGQEQQALGQKSADTAYSDFVEQRNYPRDTAAFMNQIVRGFNPPTSTAQTYAGPGTNFQPSPLAALAGTAIGGATLYNAFAPKKKGGLIKSKGGLPVARRA
jgi:hypothetical protein